MAPTNALLTADDYFRLPNLGRPTELVRGKVVTADMPGAMHGWVSAQIAFALMSFNERQRLGHVLMNNSGVVTTRNPDSVRGPDVAFYSYDRLPSDRLPVGYPDQPPELVFEVLSPSDRSSELKQKAVEYLDAGVRCVCIIDPAQETVVLYNQDRPPETLAGEALFEVANILPGFSVPIRRFFEDAAA